MGQFAVEKPVAPGSVLSGNQQPVGQSGVAATLQERAMVTEADMIVMGGYDHSHLREFVLVGATRDTLARTDIPTLLSH